MRKAAGIALVAALSVALAGCGTGSTSPAGTPGTPGTPGTSGTASNGSPTTTSTAGTAGTGSATGTGSPTGNAQVGTSPAPAAAVTGLAAVRGKVIVIDPGHDGGNGSHPDAIKKQVFVGNGYKNCDTAGAQAADGYTEHAFNWDLANRLAAVLRGAGAKVLLTRPSDTGVGPCIPERAGIANRAHADLAISVHADSSAATGSGFHVIEPASIGSNTAIVAPSRRLGTAIRDAFAAGTGQPYSNYTGRNGISVRADLGGLNLSTVPKVFLECGNMNNPTDLARLSAASWRQQAAQAIAAGMAGYLSGR